MPDVQVLAVAATFIVVVLSLLVFSEVELGGWGFWLHGKKPRRPKK
jgi:short subunit fatty acids transporter